MRSEIKKKTACSSKNWEWGPGGLQCADRVTHSDEILTVSDFSIQLNKSFSPCLYGLRGVSAFTQLVHEPAHYHGNTLDLILSHRISALTVSLVTSVASDRFLIRFEATLACPCNVRAVGFTTRYSGQSTLTSLGEQLPVVLPRFTAATGPAENSVSDINAAVSSLSWVTFYKNNTVKGVCNLLKERMLLSRSADDWSTNESICWVPDCVRSDIFEIISLETSQLVFASKATFFLLNLLPTQLFRDYWPILGPRMLNIVNFWLYNIPRIIHRP